MGQYLLDSIKDSTGVTNITLSATGVSFPNGLTPPTTNQIYTGGGSFNANVRVDDADLVMTIADNPYQIFNITASRNVTLPTTSVAAGYRILLQNRAGFDLVVKSSNGSALTYANSANVDATIRNGFVLLVALAPTPTTPAQWKVIDLQENYGLVTGTTGGAVAVAFNIYMARSLFVNTLRISSAVAASGAAATITLPASTIPLRFYSGSSELFASCIVNTGSQVEGGFFQTNSGGGATFRRVTQTNFATNAGITASTSQWQTIVFHADVTAF